MHRASSRDSHPISGSYPRARSSSDYAALIQRVSLNPRPTPDPTRGSISAAVVDLPPIRATSSVNRASHPGSFPTDGVVNSRGTAERANYTPWTASAPPVRSQGLEVYPGSGLAITSGTGRIPSSISSEPSIPVGELRPLANASTVQLKALQEYSGPLDQRAQREPSVRAPHLAPAKRDVVLQASTVQLATLQAYKLDLQKENRMFMEASRARQAAMLVSKKMDLTAQAPSKSNAKGHPVAGAVIAEMHKNFGSAHHRPRESRQTTKRMDDLNGSQPTSKLGSATPSSNSASRPDDDADDENEFKVDWISARQRWLCRWLLPIRIPQHNKAADQLGAPGALGSWQLSMPAEKELFALVVKRQDPNKRGKKPTESYFLDFLLEHGPDLEDWPEGYTIPYNQDTSDAGTRHQEKSKRQPDYVDDRVRTEDDAGDIGSINDAETMDPPPQTSGGGCPIPICTICLDYFRPRTPQLLLSCSHSVHAVCLDSFERYTIAAFKEGRSDGKHRCPECRCAGYSTKRIYDGALITGFYFILRAQAMIRGSLVRRRLKKVFSELGSVPNTIEARRAAMALNRLEIISQRMERLMEARSGQVHHVLALADGVISTNRTVLLAAEERERKLRALKRSVAEMSISRDSQSVEDHQQARPDSFELKECSEQPARDAGYGELSYSRTQTKATALEEGLHSRAVCFVCMKPVHVGGDESAARHLTKSQPIHHKCARSLQRFLNGQQV